MRPNPNKVWEDESLRWIMRPNPNKVWEDESLRWIMRPNPKLPSIGTHYQLPFGSAWQDDCYELDMKIHNKCSVVDIAKVPIEIQNMILKRLHTLIQNT
jgi:hypothetical protein